MPQLIIGLRVLKRQGLYGLMAVLGLAIGLAVAITALLYTWQETHYDSHIPRSDRIFLIDSKITVPGRTESVVATVPGALSEALRGVVPGLEDTARLWRQWSSIRIDDRFNFNLQVIGVEAAWVEMIDLPMVSGTSSTFGDDTSSVLISEAMATRLYGDQVAVGQTFELDQNAMVVTGVYRNFPTASHMVADVIIPIKAAAILNRGISLDDNWRSLNVFTYLLLEPGADVAAVEQLVENTLYQNLQLDGRLAPETTAEDIVTISLQRLSDLHLNDRTYNWGIKPPADKLKLAVFSAIAVLIVVIACINHINLSTIRSIERTREVALRRIHGAGRKQLIMQFLLEASVLAMVALVLALTIVELSSSYTSELLQTQLDLSALTAPSFLLWMAALILLVIGSAGLYPAIIVSAVMPGRLLASNSRGAKGNARMRSALVVFQFSVSIMLAIGAAVIWSQLRYARTADLGFNAENVQMLYGVGRGPARTIALTRGLEQSIGGLPGIVAVSASNSTPAWDYVPEVSIRRPSEAPESAQTMGRISVGLDFFDLLEMKPVAGRLFSEDYGVDRGQWELETRGSLALPIIINERALASLGFSAADDAIGQQIQFTVSQQNDRVAEIVGVVKNIHFKSLKNAIQPMVYYPDPAIFSVILVRLDPNQREIGLQSVEQGWNQVMPNQPLSGDFLSSALAEQYDSETQELKTVSVLAGLGILIAIFGQYGLAAYSAQSRRREISIRKVLGARVRDILQLFVWQFSKPVFLAMLVAWPFAFFAMTMWLENFVYRVIPNPLWFVLAGVFALTIALLTVAGHALKAARTAPVEALRHE